jgi:hypothetical protein
MSGYDRRSSLAGYSISCLIVGRSKIRRSKFEEACKRASGLSCSRKIMFSDPISYFCKLSQSLAIGYSYKLTSGSFIATLGRFHASIKSANNVAASGIPKNR